MECGVAVVELSQSGGQRGRPFDLLAAVAHWRFAVLSQLHQFDLIAFVGFHWRHVVLLLTLHLPDQIAVGTVVLVGKDVAVVVDILLHLVGIVRAAFWFEDQVFRCGRVDNERARFTRHAADIVRWKLMTVHVRTSVRLVDRHHLFLVTLAERTKNLLWLALYGTDVNVRWKFFHFGWKRVEIF